MIWVCSLFFIVITAGQDENENISETLYDNASKKILGQQYLRQTTVAKVVGGNVPEEVLALLRNETIKPNSLSEKDYSDRDIPHLITDNVKTTSTRIAIPLSTNLMSSEWYRNTLKKFLTNNKISIDRINPLQSVYDAPVDVPLVILKLEAAINFRFNILKLFKQLLYKNFLAFPEGYNAALSHIHQLVLLRRIPILDILDALDDIYGRTLNDQAQVLFQRFESVIPKYMKSCTTFLIEGLSDGSVDFEKILPADSNNTLFHGISASESIKKPMFFPKVVLSSMNNRFDQSVGLIFSAVISAVSYRAIELTPRLIGLMYLNLPLNIVSPHAEQVALHLISSNDPDASEDSILVRAVDRVDPKNATSANEVIKQILINVLKTTPSARISYEVLLGSIEEPSDIYSQVQINEVVHFSNTNELNVLGLLETYISDDDGHIKQAKEGVINKIESQVLTDSFSNTSLEAMTALNYLEELLSNMFYMKNVTNELRDQISVLLVYLRFLQITKGELYCTPEQFSYLLTAYNSYGPVATAATELQNFLRDGCITEYVPISYRKSPQLRSYIVDYIQFTLNHELLRSEECKKSAQGFLKDLESLQT